MRRLYLLDEATDPAAASIVAEIVLEREAGDGEISAIVAAMNGPGWRLVDEEALGDDRGRLLLGRWLAEDPSEQISVFVPEPEIPPLRIIEAGPIARLQRLAAMIQGKKLTAPQRELVDRLLAAFRRSYDVRMAARRAVRRARRTRRVADDEPVQAVDGSA